jgi:large subunit ribosomal protein L16
MFEVDGVSKEIAQSAPALGAAKLPIKTRFTARIDE